MKQILVISDRTPSFVSQLLFPGVSTRVSEAEALDESICGKETVLLLDMERLDRDASEYCCEIARAAGAISCAFAGTGWNGFDSLLPLGIACFIRTEELSADPLSVLSLFRTEEGKDLAVFIDDDPCRTAVAEAVFSLFGHRFLSIKNPEDLFSIRETADLFVLHNITMESADLLSFVKKGSASTLFRTMPYIAFTHGSNAVTLKEISSGISRLTGYILSEEEVWSVAVFNLYRKNLYAGADGLAKKIRLHENGEWGKDPVRKLFFSREAKFFTAPGKAEAAHLQSSGQFLKSLSLLSERMKYLSWLVRDQQTKTNMAFGPHC